MLTHTFLCLLEAILTALVLYLNVNYCKYENFGNICLHIKNTTHILNYNGFTF